MATHKLTTAAALVATACLLSTPSHAETQTVRTWYNDGNFTVTENADPSDGSAFCTAIRGNAETALFGVMAAPNFIAFDLMDRGQVWRPGQVVLTVDGRTWTATATVSQKYPNQLWIQPKLGTTELKSFVAAPYNGLTLTVAGYGRPYPFSYQVSLAGSYAALNAASQCVNSLIARNETTPAPTPVRPTAPTVRRYI